MKTNSPPAPIVFINYRVADSLPVAAALHRELIDTLAFGQVFLDHRNLEAGEAWPDRLRAEVARSDVMLVLIGARWLTLQGEDGIRRLDEPDDWVRHEIETAFALDKFVVPILVDDAQPPTKLAFRTTPRIEKLATLEAVRLATKDWDTHLVTIIGVLEKRGFRRRSSESTASKSGEVRPFRSTVPTRGHAPFEGRESPLTDIERILADTTATRLLVLYGPSGVGKSELAREYARQRRASYPGGTFVVDVKGCGPPVDLARIGRTVLRLPTATALSLEDECQAALLALSDAPTLLIYDNAEQVEDLDPWLPPDGMPCHVIVTTVRERWDERWDRIPVPPLSDVAARAIVEQLAGTELASRFGSQVIQQAGGLPVQLVPAARSLRVAGERSTISETPDGLTEEALASFNRTWTALSDDAKIVLWAATFFHRERISPEALWQALNSTMQWGNSRFRSAVAACSDILVLQGTDPLRMHSLWGRFVRLCFADAPHSKTLDIQKFLFDRLRDAAEELEKDPASVDAKLTVLSFEIDVTAWDRAVSAQDFDARTFDLIASALDETGRFAEARAWYERAVLAKERYRTPSIDHESLGVSLHGVGHCLYELGDFVEARPWFERAVEEAKRGDADGHVDHESIGRSMGYVGTCLMHNNQFAEALPWFTQAVGEFERGDMNGDIDHDSLGRALHQEGFCHFETGQEQEAHKRFQRAAEEKSQGDAEGRVDCQSLGSTFAVLGFWLVKNGNFTEGRTFYERAAENQSQGDVHGRINHSALGVSLHQLAHCLVKLGDIDGAFATLQRATAAKERGDIHGRVDYESLGRSLQQAAVCLATNERYDEAQVSLEQAVIAKARGDVFGKIDHPSLAMSREMLSRLRQKTAKPDQ